MLSKDITEYAKIKSELYAYVSYLFTQNIKNYLKEPTLTYIQLSMERIKQEVRIKEDIFILDKNGNLIDREGNIKSSFAQNSLERGYFYEAVTERRCILTNPYPTRSNRGLVVTAAYPIYNDQEELFYVVCMHIPIKIAIALSSSSRHYGVFAEGSVVMYFGISITLALVALLLFIKSLSSLYMAFIHFSHFDIKEVFHPIVLLTLALATVDLVKAIFEEEVLGKNSGDNHHAIHRTMIRFLGSIIIALAIEALMLVFKFSISSPDKIVYAVYLTGGVAALLISLAIYVRFSYSAAKDSNSRR
ncbi:N-linked glycosylation glycosyltransferase [Helicobacter suis]|uniref:N-linked glycosylation glycosyltransferase n=1 Tax=Helicobacter suis TaxID=104628 RepID=A0ABM7L1D5_9HELI|nr:PDC sensor domain-containing protein [Helicobacter suis]BCD46480.1 N-linked glycosylation glycosyltransferase [Helicobacter suis]BCD49365.1 N-linked glycosylation glycosyltransferase [Helicobacter suis]GFK16477.1 N-linked glycosylation glycosyltransferase [Helicobacter suis]